MYVGGWKLWRLALADDRSAPEAASMFESTILVDILTETGGGTSDRRAIAQELRARLRRYQDAARDLAAEIEGLTRENQQRNRAAQRAVSNARSRTDDTLRILDNRAREPQAATRMRTNLRDATGELTAATSNLDEAMKVDDRLRRTAKEHADRWRRAGNDRDGNGSQ